jgi:hypothetical protein
MAITTVDASYSGSGPAKSGQILVEALSGDRSRALFGYATFTGDGSSTTAVFNWIDGTETLPFTPSAVFVSRAGGTDTAAGVPYIDATGFDDTTCSVAFTTAPANTTTQIVGFIALK